MTSVQPTLGTPFATTAQRPVATTTKVRLTDGAATTIHVAAFPRQLTAARVAVFDAAEPLADWCARHQIHYAMTGGFFSRQDRRPLGEVWMRGIRVETSPFGQHRAKERSALHIDGDTLRIATLAELPGEPQGDLMTAGPALVRHGRSVVSPDSEFEGIPETWETELDDDWTQWRAARTAIGYDANRIWAVASDGPLTNPDAPVEVDVEPCAGLYLWEMAEIMLGLGVTEALNLDGGGGASLIYNQKLINEPLAGTFDPEPNGTTLTKGRPIHSAIAFLPR